MKQKLTLVLAILLLATSAFAQKTKKTKVVSDGKKGTLIGVHFNMADYIAPSGIKNPVTGKVYQTFKQMDKGLSLSYWKGLTSKVDFSAKLNIMFRDYSAIYYGLTQKTEVGT